MKVGIMTLGCKVNTYESEYVISLFESKGYEIMTFDDICDVYIINTCTVTNQSDSKSRKMINQAIKKNPDAIVVAMGCFIEANKDITIDGVDILIGNKDKSKIVELVEAYKKEKTPIRNLYDNLDNDFEDMEIENFHGRTRAFVKIQDGCENFCSYCIIPFVRGKCRSKKENLVINEIEKLVDNGYQEIVLTGIHTGNYGVDLNTSFKNLLDKLLDIKDLYRLRISSIEITELNDPLLELIKNSSCVANHLHIPLQSGSNQVLKLMNRKYNTKYFKEKIDKIRSLRPGISITTDVIVGFPGETEELYLETLNFCKEIGFSKIHVFPYSKRETTAAARFPNQLDVSVKKERAKKLIALSNELEHSYMNSYLGKEVEVLIESSNGKESFGHTSNYLYVKVNGIYKSEEKIMVLLEKIEDHIINGTKLK